MQLTVEEYIHEVIPSPGTEDKTWDLIDKKLEALKGVAKTVHIDIVDGKFATNTTFLDPKPFAKYAKDFLLEVHLMVDDPLSYLQPFADAGFKRFIGHVEKMKNINEFIAEGQLLGEVGLGIDIDTKIDAIKVNLDDLDCILIMTVKAGFSGQAFMEAQLDKVKKLREKTMIPIEIDGGVKDTNILFAKSAGATRFVVTHAIWSAEHPLDAYKKLGAVIK